MEARLKEVKEIAEGFISEYVPNYKFKFSNGIRTLGYCSYQKKEIRLSKSYVLSNSDDLVLDTILHEIAHALAGHGAGHGYLWKQKCREIGARPVRCKADAIIPDTVYKYALSCVNACWNRNYIRKPRISRTHICKRCKGQLVVRGK